MKKIKEIIEKLKTQFSPLQYRLSNIDGNYFRKRTEYQHGILMVLNNQHLPLLKAQFDRRYSNNSKYDNYHTIVMNPLARVSDIRGILYDTSPNRFLYDSDLGKNKIFPKLEKELFSDFGSSFKLAHRFHNSIGNPVLVPYLYRTDGRPITDIKNKFTNLKMKIRVIQPHNVAGRIADDREIDLLCKWDETGTYSADIFDPETNTRRVYNIEETDDDLNIGLALDKSNHIFVSEYGTAQGSELWEYGNWLKLAMATLSINEKETFSEYISYMKSFKQMAQGKAGEFDNDAPKDIRVGNDVVLKGEYELLDLVDKDLSFEKLLETKSAFVTQEYGITKNLLLGEAKTPKQWQVNQMEKYSIFKKQVELWQKVESKTYDAIFELTRKHELIPTESKSWQVLTDFLEPITIIDPKARLDLFEKREKMGLTNYLEMIQRNSEYISNEELAEKIYRKNIDSYAERIDVIRKLQVENEAGQEKSDATALKTIKKTLNGAQGATGPTME